PDHVAVALTVQFPVFEPLTANVLFLFAADAGADSTPASRTIDAIETALLRTDSSFLRRVPRAVSPVSLRSPIGVDAVVERAGRAAADGEAGRDLLDVRSVRVHDPDLDAALPEVAAVGGEHDLLPVR